MLKDWWNKINEQPGGNNSLKAQMAVNRQNDIAQAIALLAAEVLRSSNSFTDAEEKFATAFFKQHFPAVHTSRLIDSIRNHFTIGSRPMLRITCRQLMSNVDETSFLLIIRFLLGLAGSDNFIHARELRCIHRIAQYLHVSEQMFEDIKKDFTDKNNPYALLGVSETASLAEVKKAYRSMVLKHHPDKRAHHQTEAEAAQSFRAVQHAYEVILAGYSSAD